MPEQLGGQRQSPASPPTRYWSKNGCLMYLKLRENFTDEIEFVYSVELVVQEHEEGGPIVAISSLPEFKPPPGHQMSSLNMFQFPSEVFSLFEKLQINFKGGKESLSKSSPLINVSLRGTVVLAPA